MARPNEGKKKKLNCPVCGMTFYSYLRSDSKVTYCSRQCYRIGCKNQNPELVRTRAVSNTGKKRTLEQRGNMSLGQKRNLVVIERRRRLWLGELNPLWKGGKGKDYIHWNDSAYKHWRFAVFQRDSWSCQSCGLTGVYLTAHHMKGWSNFPELRYELNNGVTLCESCHSITDNYKGRGAIKR